ncbi:riboflavin synthase subunit alpha [Buchnera aphidicola (Macrosiphoniella sanborni)]|uniref:Riboflavin synthase n=1 Tax=Buchnera aphidicola (Macrosiphoniella sanborni) TaxID=1241865 RepID=A0A4D6Y393_9GAMM|nr:riboflavin synthase subunit alpha [Buchnera aphidicola]QCI23677.1 riboflavin synthase subunit alpha [Buchnera aphidicola (Macrosiphoniella sanborni)]
MFTGIVNGIATIVLIKKKKNIYTFTVEISLNLFKNLKVGDSVAYNGCCVTIKSIHCPFIICDIIKETLNITNLGLLSVGDRINFEKSVKYGDAIGGHIISGHIMTTAYISSILNLENNCTIWLILKNKILMKYLFYKGFICIDGISLTVNNIIKSEFCVNIIPHTLLVTTIGKKKQGSIVNIEIDFYTQTIVDTTERLINKKIRNNQL